MTIRQKTILAATLVLLCAAGLIATFSSRIVLRGFDNLEIQNARQNVVRVRAVLEDQFEQLDTTTHDWARWDDCYAFVEDGNEAFIHSSITEETLAGLGLSAIVFVHSSGRVTHAAGIEWPSGHKTALSPQLLDLLLTCRALHNKDDTDRSTTGFLPFGDRILLFAARPILTSQGKGPVRGILIMARELSDETIRNIGRKTQLTLAFHRLPASSLPPPVSDWAAQPASVDRLLLPEPRGRIRNAYTVFADSKGKPCLLVDISLPRDIHAHALNVLYIHTAVMVLITLIGGMALVLLMEKLVLSRTADLDRELRIVASRQDSSLRVRAEGNDEIAGLAHTINDMLESLAQVQCRVRESEKEFRDILSNMDMLVVLLNREGQVVFCNDLALKTTGWSRDELAGRNWFQEAHPHEPELEERYRRQIATEDLPSHYESCIETRQGAVHRIAWSSVLTRDSSGRVNGSAFLGRDVTEMAKAEKELMRIRAAIDDTSDAIAVANETGEVIYLNVAFGTLLKHTLESLRETGLQSIFNNGNQGEAIISDTLRGGHWRDETVLLSSQGQSIPALVGCTPIMDDHFAQVGLAMTIIDLTAQKQAEEERLRMEAHLMQSQKLESVGQLAAGIAHEINTPIQFIGDNLRFLDTGFADLLRLISSYVRLRKTVEQSDLYRAIAQASAEAEEHADLAYLEAEIPKAISQSREGIIRVADIVRAMKEFSHPSTEEKSSVDINRAIETTVTIARNEWKYVADVNLDLDPTLSHISGLPGDLNQVMLNLIVNAAHAIADARGQQEDRKGIIAIATRRLETDVEIRVSDSGTGIPEENRRRIFEPFFTTKDVGRGTGQGLYMARNVIVKKHGGTIRFESRTGVGTTFILTLPIGDKPI